MKDPCPATGGSLLFEKSSIVTGVVDKFHVLDDGGGGGQAVVLLVNLIFHRGAVGDSQIRDVIASTSIVEIHALN